VTRNALTLSLLGGALLSAPLNAQVLGLPVVNNGVASGLSIAADVGFANFDGFTTIEASGATTIGASASVGLGLVGLTGTLAHSLPDIGDGVWSPGISGTLRLLGGPLIPLRVVLLAGVAHWQVDSVDFTHVPVSLGFAATIPLPGFAIKPWIAPRLDVLTASPQLSGSTTEERFALSGGIEVQLLLGITVRASYDQIYAKNGNPSVFSLGAGFSL
jgi:opacity protein-like surface antigen